MIEKINVPECVKIWHFQPKMRKFFGRGALLPSQTLPQWGGGNTLPHASSPSAPAAP